ncbi:Glu/Leu/Phe/Val dehydrogenase dimerization domain-containing protein [Candidatus Odyssella acanthamoebae]|uniref:Glutamate/phenylalanine/leucine/valine/L-tryptophan dehydrogenase C-terminal domain-containing protein n=1 Tax=Candidatus Odyssella acanthamoebae TaxID=91604 RepID=A0A077AVN6_9PROT|nr:Glu/Leu/Phe/Val dehydrogenase dimerization domain-containing protein [Candidatus Paracaedibacter acanthamoebae]AIK95728.1 hypothetical protein ID47_01720 [Candidatus Paracaedibacter acanthamoebae]
MRNPIINKAHKIITWQDKENTGAIGWIVIHNVVNGVAGGGLFMHESACLQEVKDLAYTMSLKNSLQHSIFGGGKGGIKFDPAHPAAISVLKRFLYDNSEIIKNEWCTGGDLNTTTKDITVHLKEVADIKSPFICLANMVEKTEGIKVDIDKFNQCLYFPENDFFTVEQTITGYSLFKTIETGVKVKNTKPKLIIQGLGKVARAFCYWAQSAYDIVGICERDWYIYNPEGIDIDPLLSLDLDTYLLASPQALHFTKRKLGESSEEFLLQFLSQVQGDIFCPCATRYTITEKVLKALISNTLANSSLSSPFIISGANDVFREKNLITEAFKNNVTVLPEWLSNSGSAILFMEALKYQDPLTQWNDFIKQQVADRIVNFLTMANNLTSLHKLNIYDACCYLAYSLVEADEQKLNKVA